MSVVNHIFETEQNQIYSEPNLSFFNWKTEQKPNRSKKYSAHPYTTLNHLTTVESVGTEITKGAE